jgi:primase-polymerase (primpol)-like protein
MASDFPFLDALAEEIDKVHFETEERAKKMIQNDIAGLRLRQDEAFKLAGARIEKHQDAIKNMSQGLTKVIDKLSNSGETTNPTGQNSSDNSKT